MTPTAAAILIVILALAALSVGFMVLNPDRRSSPRPTWVGYGLWRLMWIYGVAFHRVQIEGRENLPPNVGQTPGPLIIVPNHTGGTDPVMIQIAPRFEIRWMMTSDYNVGLIRPFARWARLILIDQDGRDLASTRKALRHLRDGGVLGIFPEGGIERPPEQLRRFHPGVGLLAVRSGATVIPVWISGTPKVDRPMAAFIVPGRIRVVFGLPIHCAGETDPEAVAAKIRAQIAEMSGWPTAEEPGPDSQEAERAPGTGQTA